MDTDHTGNIFIDSQVRNYRVNNAIVIKIVKTLLDLLNLSHFEVSISFVSETLIKQLNREYRQKDKPTDVLSFPQFHFEQLPSVENPYIETKEISDNIPITLGDIVICPKWALRNAQQIGHDLSREIAFLLIHGFLHLCGYDHIEPDDEIIMLNQQKQLLVYLADSKSDRPVWHNCINFSARL